ncbi:DMT family transporter [Sphingomonas echinoides]|uniref:DMT family transporter n=1 Tax=Sphingomonas echinoides TaxID=59803 RepID=UPI002413151E|nr:DMT family transporter [Sphingomonas echinoides]
MTSTAQLSERKTDRIRSAIGMRLMSVILFAVMNVVIKLAERHGAALGEILFFRQLGASFLIGGIVLAGPGWRSVATQRIGTHISRAVLGLAAMAFTFTTIVTLPLAEATTLGFTMPIFATILGALILHEPTGWHRWGAVLAGFAGVLIVAQPGSGHFPLWGAATGLLGALGTAGVSILLRQITRTESAMTVVFWFSTLSLLPLGICYALVARNHPLEVWLLLAGVGLIGGVAQLAMTSALGLGPVSVVVPMDYSSLLWATLFGWLIFGTLPAPTLWIGAPVIVGSGLYILWRERIRHINRLPEPVQ